MKTWSRAATCAGSNYPFLTSKERDIETGLDYSIHRYYSSTQGRFTSPDALLSSGRPQQPQGWNRYTYVLNRPLSLVDPNGLDWGVANWTDQDGTRHTRYQWFNGEIGDSGGQHYTAVDFGGDSSRVIDLSDGRTVSISNDPNNRFQDITAHPQAEQAPVLQPCLADHLPVLGAGRKFLFDYTTHNFEGALGDFAQLSGDLAFFAAPFAAPAEAAEQGVLRFSQTTASHMFSDEGTFAGKTIGQLANDLRSGAVAAKGCACWGGEWSRRSQIDRQYAVLIGLNKGRNCPAQLEHY